MMSLKKSSSFAIAFMIAVLLVITPKSAFGSPSQNAVRTNAPAYNSVLHIGHKKTVTLWPHTNLADSAQILSSTITVKAHNHVLAKNVKKLNVGRGVFSVRSKTTYRPRVIQRTYWHAASPFYRCRIIDVAIDSDRTEYTDTGSEYVTNYLSGQVTFTYTGDCSSDGLNYSNSQLSDGAYWEGTWYSDESVFADAPDPNDTSSVILGEADYHTGDMAYTSGPVDLVRAVAVRGRPATQYITSLVLVTK